MFKLWKIAVRDLLRNRRRTLLTLLAVVVAVLLAATAAGPAACPAAAPHAQSPLARPRSDSTASVCPSLDSRIP